MFRFQLILLTTTVSTYLRVSRNRQFFTNTSLKSKKFIVDE